MSISDESMISTNVGEDRINAQAHAQKAMNAALESKGGGGGGSSKWKSTKRISEGTTSSIGIHTEDSYMYL